MAGGRMSKAKAVIHLNTSISKALNQQISSTLLIIWNICYLNYHISMQMDIFPMIQETEF